MTQSRKHRFIIKEPNIYHIGFCRVGRNFRCGNNQLSLAVSSSV